MLNLRPNWVAAAAVSCGAAAASRELWKHEVGHSPSEKFLARYAAWTELSVANSEKQADTIIMPVWIRSNI
jgi:hypothetical protein